MSKCRTITLLGLLATLAAAPAAIAQDTTTAPAQPATPPPDAPATAGPRPVLIFETTKHDFGKVPEEKPQEFSLKFSNKGDDRLVITEFKPSCGCTTVKLDKKDLPPGESAVAIIRFDPILKQGPQHNTITVRSNDPDNPVQTIEITGDVVPRVIIDPAKRIVELGTLPRGSTKSIIVTFTGRTDDFAVRNPTLLTDAISAKVLDTKPVEIDGQKLRQTRIELTLKSDAKPQKIQDNLTVRTNDPLARIIRVPVSGEIVGTLKSEPASVQLGILAPGSEFSSTVTVSTIAGTPFGIKDVRYVSRAGPDLDISFDPKKSDKGDSYTIAIKGKAPADERRYAGDMVVQTDSAGDEVLRLPVFITIRAPGSGQ